MFSQSYLSTDTIAGLHVCGTLQQKFFEESLRRRLRSEVRRGHAWVEKLFARLVYRFQVRGPWLCLCSHPGIPKSRDGSNAANLQ